MAVCYSVAWEAKVLANAWWVYHNQVSKQAPTGEYIGTGSFMIRGKKNYLISSALIFGFGLMYKLDEASVERHKNDRRIKTAEEEKLIDDKYANVEFEEASETIEETQEESDDKQEVEVKDIEVKEQSNEEKEDEEESFPDTQFEMKPVSKLEEACSSLNIKENAEESDEDSENDQQNKDTVPKPQENKLKTSKQMPKEEVETKKTNQTVPLKRGQKARLNKMKTKYKDQDDEDREIIMKYLAPVGESKPKKEDKKKQPPQQKQQQQAKKKPLVIHKVPNVQPVTDETPVIADETQVNNENAAADLDPDEDAVGQNIEDELAILNSLTGIPLEEDEILFCLPVCAPYNCLQNYKHKVKLNPGTTKRGQAVKTALEIFLRDKPTTTREKDLIRTNLIKDQDISRNLPGKVLYLIFIYLRNSFNSF